MLLSHVKWSVGNWVGEVMKIQAIFCPRLRFRTKVFLSLFIDIVWLYQLLGSTHFVGTS